MTLDYIQKEVDEWASQFDPKYWPPLDQLAQLTEETGEVARELNHLYGHKKKKSEEQTSGLASELTEVLFVLCCIANKEDISLQEQWDKMMRERQYGRDNQRFERKDDSQ